MQRVSVVATSFLFGSLAILITFRQALRNLRTRARS